MGNMPTKKFSHSFKTVAAPGIFRIFLAVCSDFHYIAEKGVAHHLYIYKVAGIFYLGQATPPRPMALGN